MAPLFVDRAAKLAESGGRPLRQLWFVAETGAAWYHGLAGQSPEALRRRPVDPIFARLRAQLSSPGFSDFARAFEWLSH
jgi:hypothetical protein